MSGPTPEQRPTVQEKVGYEDDKARITPLAATAKRKWRLSMPNLIFLAVIGLLLLASAGSYAYRAYRMSRLREKLTDALGRDLVLTGNVLNLAAYDSGIYYQEVLDLCNKSVEARTNLIAGLRGLYPDLDDQFRTLFIQYLGAENEFVRAKLDFYEKAMEQSATRGMYESAASAGATLLKCRPSQYSASYYQDQLTQMNARLIEAANAAERSADEFLAAYDKIAKQEEAIADAAKGAGLPFETIFGKQATANHDIADHAKEEVQKFRDADMELSHPVIRTVPGCPANARDTRTVLSFDNSWNSFR